MKVKRNHETRCGMDNAEEDEGLRFTHLKSSVIRQACSAWSIAYIFRTGGLDFKSMPQQAHS
jgi:hypothetical protein